MIHISILVTIHIDTLTNLNRQLDIGWSIFQFCFPA